MKDCRLKTDRHRTLHIVRVFAFALLAVAQPPLARSQEAAVAEGEARLDADACEQWRATAIEAAEKDLGATNDEYKQAYKAKDREKMKELLAKKKGLTRAIAELKAKNTDECRAEMQKEKIRKEEETRQQKAKEDEIARQRAVWEAAENAEKAKKEAEAAKAARDKEFIARHRESLKNGRNVLTRNEFKEKVRPGMAPSKVITLVGAPDKTQESGDLRSFVYYNKTIDDLTGNEDRAIIVNFWKGEVRSVTVP